MIYTKNNFPEIASRPNWFLTWTIRIVLIFLSGLLVLAFFATPVLLYRDESIYGPGAFVFFVFYYPFIIGMSVLLIKTIKRNKPKAGRKITVDHKGIHYERLDGMTDSILYTQLERTKTSGTGDVFVRYVGIRYKQTLLTAMLKGIETTIAFDKIDMAYSYYVANKRELRSHFIQGVHIFRPDLSISPVVYSDFYIDKVTYEFNKKSYRKTIVISAVIIALIFGAIMWHTWSR